MARWALIFYLIGCIFFTIGTVMMLIEELNNNAR